MGNGATSGGYRGGSNLGGTLTPRAEREELAQLLAEQETRGRLRAAFTVFDMMYPWQREFVASTAMYHEACLCAANQIGKTMTGTDIDAIHLLGDYPDDWPGHKFVLSPMCWGLGYSMEKTRDLLQSAIFGDFVNNTFTGGLVPRERIIDWESASGTPNAMRTVRVRHATGEASTMQFWSYSQGQHAIMGDIVDWYHIDEEPKDPTIRTQVMTRTINGDNGQGGRGIYTFTPENGRTEMVVQFMDTPSPSQFFMQKGWDDAPHITLEKRERMLLQYPLHQRDMRTKGIPMLGHGRIYDLSEDFIICDEPEILPHWYVIGGMDFGWDHPHSHILLVEDRDNDQIYITRARKQRHESANNAWGANKHWAEGVPMAWPHDGLQSEKGRDDAKQQKEHYADAGFLMLDEHATWETGGNSVESGLYEISARMRKRQFRICRGLRDLLDEILQYHRKENGKINKSGDDLLDAVRYAYMMRRFAVRYGELNEEAVKINFKGWG